MRKCPACQADVNVLDALCPRCGKELPAPYEGWDAHDDQGRATAVPADEALDLDRHNLQPEQLTILSGAEVILNEGSFNPGTVILAEGRILEVLGFALTNPHDGATFADLSGHILAPGFIDLHGPTTDPSLLTVEDLTRLATEALANGVTAITPRMRVREQEHLRRSLQAMRAVREERVQGARLLGLRLDNAFANPAYGSREAFLDLLEEYKSEVMMVTLAPELEDAEELIRRLCALGIAVSLGYSDAEYLQALRAVEAGATHVTHLFQDGMMEDVWPDAPGLLGAALERDELFTEVVCGDGAVHPAWVSATISAKGAERTLPVTWPGYLVDEVGWDLGEALNMLSATPALFLGLRNAGSIAVGMVGDLVLLDQDLDPVGTFISGNLVWRRE